MSFGRVLSLHVHPQKAGDGMTPVRQIDLEAEKGIVQDKRYFARRSASGSPSKRQVTLIEREQVIQHSQALGLSPFPPGVVRSNIETEGIDLVPLAGKRVKIGSATLLIGPPRDPCEKMDQIAPGLRELMDHGRQGVLAQVVSSGQVRLGDPIVVVED